MWDNNDVVIVTEGESNVGLVKAFAVRNNMKILLDALDHDARLHDAAMIAIGVRPDFVIIDELPQIKENLKVSGKFFNPEGIVENNNWRKSKKRGFSGYWSSKT